MAEEAAESRLYAGIHYRPPTLAGRCAAVARLRCLFTHLSGPAQRIRGPPSSPLEVVSRSSALPSGAIEKSSTSPEVLGRTDMK